MDNKKRLFEMFERVNRITVSEDIFDEWNSEEMDNLRDELEDDIKAHFRIGSRNKMFYEGIPNEMLINIKGNEIQFKLDENDGLDLDGSKGEQVNYTANYITDAQQLDPRLQGLEVDLFINVTVVVEKNHTGARIEFYTETWIDSDAVEIQFNKKR